MQLDNESDPESAQRVLEDFVEIYQPTLLAAQNHLSQTLFKMPAQYAAAYKPWHTALQDLTRGLYLLSKKIPVPDMERFIDALHMFSFEGAINFLADLCKNCNLSLTKNWETEFRQQVDRLLFSVSILNRNLAESLVR